MPELPEIEHLRRTLEPHLAGALVRRVRLLRPDVLRSAPAALAGARRRTDGTSLLRGRRIRSLARIGKELALIADGGALCVHLGMTGQLRWCPDGARLPRRDHVHCVWRIEPRRGACGRLVFRDPRRFGGLWAFPSLEVLRAVRWSRLGPDALGVSTGGLRQALSRTRRPVKAALLDQRLLAGIGNIYADEALFAAGLHPGAIACDLQAAACRRLAAAIRSVLRGAIRSGGSTIRDYVDGQGAPGAFTAHHRVYGRGSLPCLRCGALLRSMRLAQRTTVYCPICQRAPKY